MKIKKLKTDFAYTDEMNKEDSPPCKHFSIRGYVAEMRKKDWKICSPFPVSGSETESPLPPLVVPRFQSWSCNVCRGENEFVDPSGQRECCKGIQETLMHESVPERKEIDVHEVIDLTGDSDDDSESYHTPSKRIPDYVIDLEDDEEGSNSGSLNVSPSLTQEMHANERGFERNEAYDSDVEIVVSNLKTKKKSSSKVANKGKHIYEDDQWLQELRKSSTVKGKAIVITEKDVVPEHTAEQFPLDLDAEDEDENENDVQDPHQTKFNGEPDRKLKRIRLLREVIRDGGEPETEVIRKERPAPENPSNKSVDSQKQNAIMDKMVGKGDTRKSIKKGQRGRKRKLIIDEDDKPLSVIFPHEVSNIPAYIAGPSAQVAPNEEGLGEGLHHSSNRSPQTETVLALPMPIKEGQGDEADPPGEQFPSASALAKGKGVRIQEIDEDTRKHYELDALDGLLQICNIINAEKLNRKIGLGTSIDLNSDATGGSDPIPKIFNPGGSLKTMMDIIGSSKTYGSRKGGWLDPEEEDEDEETPTQGCDAARETPVPLNSDVPERVCGMNRNPADFTPVEPRNPYIREKKNEVRKRGGGVKRCGSSSKKNKKPKKP